MTASRAHRVDERSDGSDGVICGLGAPDSVDALARTSHTGRHILLRSSSAFDTQSRQLDPDGLIRNACFKRRPLAEWAPRPGSGPVTSRSSPPRSSASAGP